ncbi:MAG TPA: acetolactate synthase [Acidimicrobiales bacterium]|jgi:acetolactate synthase-1/2/3 large subunit|nr:acetolactate synthase [Acidimicrobiales bacterium]
MEGNGGDLALAALTPYGVRELFTLNGAHIWPLYDACRRADVRIVDTRHEETAGFAAEGMAKLTRRPGVAALTAGPGVTNAISPVATAQSTGSPLVVLGGRAAAGKWGQGSLQEFDHIPLMTPITKFAATAGATDDIAGVVGRAAASSMTPHRGPSFVDIGIDVIFGAGAGSVPEPVDGRGAPPDEAEVAKAAALLAGAERPLLVCGGDVWWNRAEDALRAAVEWLRVPTFVNGLGRGCLPADHDLSFARTRSFLKQADVVVVVGTPMDFRLSFGSFGDAQVVHVADDPSVLAGHVPLAAAPAGDLAAILTAFASYQGERADHEPWIAKLRDEEEARRAAEASDLAADSDPVHPARIYGELRRRLARDAVVVNDGGDFVSFSGKYVESFTPGCWLDPGPLGCLGTGLGYSIAARLAHPDRQVVCLLGDGAAGFSLMDVDTLVRHGLPVVMIVGNNGIWALEKLPMQMVYGGWDAACDLQPGLRYDDVVKALGGAGETVSSPGEIGPALDRAFASGVPYLVNVLTDPTIAYPRSSTLV